MQARTLARRPAGRSSAAATCAPSWLVLTRSSYRTFPFCNAGKTFGSPASWAQLASGDVCAKLAPAIAGAAVLWLVTHRVRSPWALPAALLVMPAVFFAVLYGPLRSDLPSARAAGWVTQSQVRAMLRACGAGMRGASSWRC